LPFKSDFNALEFQTPVPKIEVFLPENSSLAPDYTFSADIQIGALSGLQSYNFSESVDDLEGNFSFTVKNDEINGKSVFDLISTRCIIKIFEGVGNYINYTCFPSFVGIIRRKKINKQMTNNGLRESVTFSGKSIISCIVEYTISLDMRISGVAHAREVNSLMLNKIEEEKNLAIQKFMITTWEYFKKISSDVSKAVSEKDIGGRGVATTKLERIINKYIGDDPKNYITVTGEKTEFYHPISGVLINAGKNTITDIWRDKLPQKAYELFAYCDNKGNPKIMARQVPFGDPENNYEDWKNLKSYIVNPVSLISFDLDQNDEEVYTAFASWVIGSSRDRKYYIAINNDEQEDTTVFYSEKAKIYGFRPLEIDFNGYNRAYNTKEGNEGLEKTMAAFNKLIAYWYSKNDEHFSGSITIATNFKNPEKNPRIGCRASFLGGEFYINKAEHSWNYGSTPTIKLSVSRGMEYGANGEMLKAIENVGGKYRELDAIWDKPKLPTFNR